MTQAIEQHRYNEAAGALYGFIWRVFCDWYLELIKPVLDGDDTDAKAETQAFAGWTLEQILRLLHPFMPFITEELWARAVRSEDAGDVMLINAEWPEYNSLQSGSDDREIEWVINTISEIRSVRSEMNVPAAARIPLVVCGADEQVRMLIEMWGATIERMARLEGITFGDTVPKGAVQVVMEQVILALPLAGVIDMEAEGGRLEKEISKVGDEIRKLEGKACE